MHLRSAPCGRMHVGALPTFGGQVAVPQAVAQGAQCEAAAGAPRGGLCIASHRIASHRVRHVALSTVRRDVCPLRPTCPNGRCTHPPAFVRRITAKPIRSDPIRSRRPFPSIGRWRTRRCPSEALRCQARELLKKMGALDAQHRINGPSSSLAPLPLPLPLPLLSTCAPPPLPVLTSRPLFPRLSSPLPISHAPLADPRTESST